jgi:hypothetical protein
VLYEQACLPDLGFYKILIPKSDWLGQGGPRAMSQILQITFRNPNGRSEAAQKAAWERAHQIAAWPGLVWKVWIAQPAAAIYGGVYLFEDESSAQAYLNGPVVASMRSLPGVTDFSAQLFEVNEPLSAITRGPVNSPTAP